MKLGTRPDVFFLTIFFFNWLDYTCDYVDGADYVAGNLYRGGDDDEFWLVPRQYRQWWSTFESDFGENDNNVLRRLALQCKQWPVYQT